MPFNFCDFVRVLLYVVVLWQSQVHICHDWEWFSNWWI